MVNLGKEPVAIIGIVVAVLTAAQQLVIAGISSGVHAVIAVVLVGLGAILSRARVTPVKTLTTNPATPPTPASVTSTRHPK